MTTLDDKLVGAARDRGTIWRWALFVGLAFALLALVAETADYTSPALLAAEMTSAFLVGAGGLGLALVLIRKKHPGPE